MRTELECEGCQTGAPFSLLVISSRACRDVWRVSKAREGEEGEEGGKGREKGGRSSGARKVSRCARDRTSAAVWNAAVAASWSNRVGECVCVERECGDGQWRQRRGLPTVVRRRSQGGRAQAKLASWEGGAPPQPNRQNRGRRAAAEVGSSEEGGRGSPRPLPTPPPSRRGGRGEGVVVTSDGRQRERMPARRAITGTFGAPWGRRGASASHSTA